MTHRQSNKHETRWRPVLILLIGCLTMLSGLTASAQNVTISPSSGSLIAGVTYSGEVGFEQGWSSLWRHNQLPLTLHVSDKPDLTASGVLKDPAGNIRLDTDRNLYILMGGSSVTTHMSFSLPKGYRFTGYRMVMLNDMNGKDFGGFNLSSINKRMYETNSNFDIDNALASTAASGGLPTTTTVPPSSRSNSTSPPSLSSRPRVCPALPAKSSARVSTWWALSSPLVSLTWV